MRYALIENGVVTNLIYLHPTGEKDFPGAVALGDVPAAIGDSYDGKHFYRNAERLMGVREEIAEALKALGIEGGEA